MAVLRFEGYITPEVAAAVRKQLIDAVQKGEVGLDVPYMAVQQT